MPGYILLEGGAEFGGRMAEPDWRAIALAGGPDAPLCIIPAAAAPDHNDRRAGQNGAHWFHALGARQVSVLPLTDRASADDPSIAAEVQRARLVYLLGGFTHHLGQALLGTRSQAAMQAAAAAGAVIAGSSAGAMVLCQHYYNPEGGRVETGLGFVPNACVIPHHNSFGQRWARRLAELLPGVVLIGIDEQTGMLNDGPGGLWNTYGRGVVTLYHNGAPGVFPPGEPFNI